MKLSNKFNAFVLLLLISGLSACGGGGGGSSPSNPPINSSGSSLNSSVSSSSSLSSLASSSASSVFIANSVPIADAGIDQNVSTKNLITLNGSASTDANGDTLSYQWSLTSMPVGSLVALSSPTIVSPTFTPDIDGTYVAQLIVNDGKTNSVADTLTIVAKTPNSAPVANAGADQNVSTNTSVTLDGSASTDANGDALTYKWSFKSIPTGSFMFSLGAVVSPTFTPDVDGTYVVELIASDGKLSSLADTVTVIASKANSAPVANAGADQSILLNTVVNLNGNKSTDADSNGLSYSWAFVSKPSGSTAMLDNATVVNPTFRADIAGSYVLSLIVSDGIASSKSDNVQIDAVLPNVTLYKVEDALFGGGSSKVVFPYASVSSVTASVSGIPAPTTYKLDTFKLKAQGQNFTISNVSATDANAKVVPYFSGISNGKEIVGGTEVTFNLISPLTKGATANLTFSFTILETGQTFSASYTFTSN